MVDLGNEKIEEDKINDLVDSLFQRAGFNNKSAISFDEFQQVLKDYREELSLMSLDMQCELSCSWSLRIMSQSLISALVWNVKSLVTGLGLESHVLGRRSSS